MCLKRRDLFLNQYPGFYHNSPYLGIRLKPVESLLVGYQCNLIALHPQRNLFFVVDGKLIGNFN